MSNDCTHPWAIQDGHGPLHCAKCGTPWDQCHSEGLVKKIEAEARRYAGMYPQSSDGRNTFVIFADWVASLAVPSHDVQQED